MNCKNKTIFLPMVKSDGNKLHKGTAVAMVTNDELGKTLSLRFDNIQITVPFEPLEEYLK